ncbi:hypothetical protein [Halobacteriovorax sp. HLS]|uniref:hypothetical protein n=1 Tax=Halobacteriovorax sp. HLS TaxID=2234000 RepID=UPI000FD6C2D8|nr:hypothetical protein [Halobacteriovorax sp. HLS]
MFFCKKFLRKASLAFILGMLITGQSMASAVKLIDILINDSGLSQSLSKYGVRGTSATQVKSYVKNSIDSLYKFGGSTPSAKTLRMHISQIPAQGKDLKYKKDLMALLNKSESSMAEGDLVKAVNSLIYLSNRYGKRSATVLACSACVSDKLSSLGFKFTLEVMSDKQSKEVLTKMLPNQPRSLTNFINTKLAKHNIGSLAGSKNIVAPEEERALGLFLGLKEIGSADQKKLIAAIEEISKDEHGSINILNPKNPHKLWKLFSEDISESDMTGWTKLLDEVASKSAGKTSKKDTFYEILEARAAKNPEFEDRIQILKNKNCFFK